MIILGISCIEPCGIVHDVTASLLIDGKIHSAATEDRFTGIKHFEGYPASAIKFCLEKEGLKLSDVDKVAVGYGLLENQKDENSKNQFYSFARQDTTFRKTSMESKNPKFFDHEYIHAKTGYFFSGFKRAVVISLDGGGVDNGEIISGGIFVINNGKTETIRIFPLKASLGWTFGGFTEICGFRMLDGEGKTMSLAAFANDTKEKKDEIYQKILNIFPKYSGINYVEGGIDDPSWKIIHNSGFARFTDTRLVQLLNFYNKEQIAWGSQKFLEDILVNITTAAVEFTGIKNVILTGGIFFNMIANMKVREKLEEQNCTVFFNPVCGDMGNAIGAAIEEYYQQTGNYYGFEWPSLSLGPEYDDNQILSAIKRSNLSFSKVDKISTTVDLIDKGKIVGWFQGKTELGPRGLGNRSILSRADDVKFKDIINNKVKHRESWRPFCPTITEEKSDYYLENYTYAPYMILGFNAKHVDEIPAVVHIDNTTRPQTLRKSDNEEFYDVVHRMGGIILNTSLNLAGDPINATPEDALLTFKHSKMDAILIGDYLIKR